MNKEIHVFLDYIHNYPPEVLKYGYYVSMLNSRANFQRAIESEQDIIFTYQTSAVRTRYLTQGYRIFVYFLDGTVKEMKLGQIKGCNKEIRVAHNLEKMLLAGMFGKASIDKGETNYVQDEN